MSKIYDVILIGGGASNLIAATYLGDKLPKDSFCVLEKCPRVGKKLIATGNGQGNLTNKNLSGEHYFSSEKDFYLPVIKAFDNTVIEKYLNSLGIYLTGENKRYPVSYEATSVLDLIREKLFNDGVQIFTDTEVTKITYLDKLFILQAGDKKYLAKNIVLGCGGSAGKQFGTDGSAYSLITPFGHKVTKLYPSLVQLKTDTTFTKGLKGIKVDALVKAFSSNGKLLKSERGDLLFTDYGVSGSAVFQVSGHALKEENSYLEIEFLPDLSINAIKGMLAKKESNAPYLNEENLYNGLINKQLAKALIKYGKGDTLSAIKKFRLNVTGSLGFNYAQVTKGGIDVKDIDSNTLESKLIKGLFVVGEMLDVDGDCGGYNLHWAFASGLTVAKELENRV